MNDYALHYTNDPDSLICSIIHTHHVKIKNSSSYTHTDKHHTDLSHEHVKQLKDLLQQNRKDELWCDVVLPNMHSKRMQKTTHLYPELNIPRNKWLDHPHWSLNKQMTAYHVPIRCKMQRCFSHLWDAWQCKQHPQNNDVQTQTILQYINHAQNQYRLAITILESHAYKEETRTFPIMTSIFPKIDLYDMYDSHYMIQQKAQIIDNLFDVYIKHLEQNKKNINNNTNHNSIYLTKLIEQMFLLDTLLNQHLREEEDLLVPMSLCVPDAMHVSWPFSPETEGCNRVNESLSHWTTDPESVLLRCKL